MGVKKRSRLGVKPRRAVAAKRRSSSTKLAVSFDGRLASQVQRAARKKTAGNVSAWLAEAARDRLRLEGGRQLLTEYEADHGVISDEQIAEVEREWPRD